MYRIDKIIRIVKECQEKNIKITYSTEYEGYRIGRAVIQLRSHIKNNKVTPTESDLEELKELGIVEGVRRLTSIDHIIDFLIKWREEYPKLKIKSSDLTEDELALYAKTEGEKQALQQKYTEVKNKYAYVLRRRNSGKLLPEQEEKCKEAYVGAVFGYPTTIENAAKKYGISPEKIGYISSKYFETLSDQKDEKNIELAIDKFLQEYLNNSLSDKDLKTVKENLINVFEISQDTEVYRKLIQSVTDSIEGKEHKLFFYSERGISSILRSGSKKDEEMGNYLEDRFLKIHHKSVVKTRERKTKLSRSRINHIINRIKDRIIKNVSVTIPLIIDMSQKQKDEREDDLVNKLTKLLIKERVILFPDEDKKPERKEYREINAIVNTIVDKRKTEDIIENGSIFQKASAGLLQLEELKTTDISAMELRKNFEEILRLSQKELCKIRSLLGALNVSRKKEKKYGDTRQYNGIFDLDASNRTYKMLVEQFGGLREIRECTLEEFTRRAVGKRAYADALDAMDKAGISFKNEKTPRFYVGQWNQREEKEEK